MDGLKPPAPAEAEPTGEQGRNLAEVTAADASPGDLAAAQTQVDGVAAPEKAEPHEMEAQVAGNAQPEEPAPSTAEAVPVATESKPEGSDPPNANQSGPQEIDPGMAPKVPRVVSPDGPEVASEAERTSALEEAIAGAESLRDQASDLVERLRFAARTEEGSQAARAELMGGEQR